MARNVANTGDGVKLLSEYRLDPNEGNVHFGIEGPAKPWKKVSMALTLLVLGAVLLFTGVGLFVSGMQNAIPLIVIGSLAFIPGAYFSRIAYMAWRGYRGYSLANIPDV